MNIIVHVDLRKSFGGARDQGPRPTCLACAISDIHAYLRGPFVPLSAEYAFYCALCRSGVVNLHSGVAVDPMFQALELDGQPLEAAWPYSPVSPSLNVWKPPLILGELFKRHFRSTTNSLDTIRKHLLAGIPLLLGVKLSTAFYSPPKDHIITNLPLDPDTGNHAVIALGLGDCPGKSLVLVRNSWGASWADGGCAWLDEQYLLPRLLVIASGEKV